MLLSGDMRSVEKLLACVPTSSPDQHLFGHFRSKVEARRYFFVFLEFLFLFLFLIHFCIFSSWTFLCVAFLLSPRRLAFSSNANLPTLKLTDLENPPTLRIDKICTFEQPLDSMTQRLLLCKECIMLPLEKLAPPYK